MYSNQIMEEFFNPAHFENMRGASGVGKVTCENGDEIIKIFVVEKDGVITDASFQTFGGVVSIALTSFAVKYITGKTVEEARKLSADDIIAAAGSVPENRMYLVHAVVSCSNSAIDDIYGITETKPVVDEETKALKRAKRLENKQKREQAKLEVKKDALEMELEVLRKEESDDSEYDEEDSYEDEEAEESEKSLEELVGVSERKSVSVKEANNTKASVAGVSAKSSSASVAGAQVTHKKVTKKVTKKKVASK